MVSDLITEIDILNGETKQAKWALDYQVRTAEAHNGDVRFTNEWQVITLVKRANEHNCLAVKKKLAIAFYFCWDMNKCISLNICCTDCESWNLHLNCSIKLLSTS